MGAFQYYNNLHDIPEPFKRYSAENTEAKSYYDTETTLNQKNVHINKTIDTKNKNQPPFNLCDLILFYFILTIN